MILLAWSRIALSFATRALSRFCASAVNRSASLIFSNSGSMAVSSNSNADSSNSMAPSPEICCSCYPDVSLSCANGGGREETIVWRLDWSDYSPQTYHLIGLKALQQLVETVVQSQNPDPLRHLLTDTMRTPQRLHDLIDIVGHTANDNVRAVKVQIQSRIGRLDIHQNGVQLPTGVVEVVNQLLALRSVQVAAQRAHGKAQVLHNTRLGQ